MKCDYKFKKNEVIFIFMYIIEFLFISSMIVYFGYFKPFVIILNGLRGLFNNNSALEMALITIAYIQLIFILSQNILFICELISNKKEKLKLNIIFKRIYAFIIAINICLIFLNMIFDFINCKSINLLYNVIEFTMIATLFAVVFAFEYEFRKQCLLQRTMKDYI